MTKKLLIASLALSSIFLASTANAGQVLTTGDISIGVQDFGALGFSSVGLSHLGTDAITPGCLCEGWGASFGSTAGWSANANGGDNNVSLVNFTSTSSSATSIVSVANALQVTQAYAASASSSLFVDKVTLTNTTSASISDVRYSRSMDWDVPPTPFSEFVTINRGTSTALLFSNDNGFATPNPLSNPGELSSGTTNVNFADSGPNDHGAYFTFSFGALAAGESKTFNIFYGAADNESNAFSALSKVGAEVYSLGQSNTAGGPSAGTPSTFIFAFSGVGGTPVSPVPEPETYAMFLAGLSLVGFAARRKKQNQA